MYLQQEILIDDLGNEIIDNLKGLAVLISGLAEASKIGYTGFEAQGLRILEDVTKDTIKQALSVKNAFDELQGTRHEPKTL